MFKDRLSRVHEIFNGVGISIYNKCLWHEGMPVVEEVEFNIDPVVVLEGLIKKQLRLVKEMKVIAGQVINVVFDSNLDCFSYIKKVYLLLTCIHLEWLIILHTLSCS